MKRSRRPWGGARLGSAEGSCQEPIRHVSGTKEEDGFLMAAQCIFDTRLDLGLHVGAGEGNRTLMTSLEGWGSAIELRPRVPVEGVSGTG